MDGLLRRHGEVAREVLGEEGPCKVVTATYGELVAIGTKRRLPEFGDRAFECVGSITGREDDEGFMSPPDTSFWMQTTRWSAEEERPALVAIANDRLRAIWLGTASGEVYAPYDGGADLIVTDRQRRDALEIRYADWLSARPDGL